MIGKEGEIKYVNTHFASPVTHTWKGLMGIVELTRAKTREEKLRTMPSPPTDYTSKELPILIKLQYIERINLGLEIDHKELFISHPDLYLAICNDDYQQVERITSSGITIDIGNEFTFLMYAAELGRLKIATRLISHGAQINVRDYEGNTPLLLALHNGHIEVGQILLDHNADVNVANGKGITPLMYAARTGNIHIVERLLREGAKIDARDKWGRTPVFYACIQAEVIKVLLANGANINDMDSNTILLLETLGSSRDPAITEKVFNLLISSGINVNAQTKGGESALLRALNINERDISILLIESGADVNHSDTRGNTPLLIASQPGHGEVKVVETLLSHGADVMAKNKLGDTALMNALHGRYKDIAEMLILRGADINAKNLRGETPLKIAKQNSLTEIIQILISNGAKE
jgi:ankyrin repeat protein